MPPEKPFTIHFDTAVYRLSAIKKAAYCFGDRCFVDIQVDGAKILVNLIPKHRLENIDHLQGDFKNAVLDYELREQVAQETEGIRNLIMAQAFSAISLVDPEGDSADYSEDPLQIRSSQTQTGEMHESPGT